MNWRAAASGATPSRESAAAASGAASSWRIDGRHIWSLSSALVGRPPSCSSASATFKVNRENEGDEGKVAVVVKR